MMPKINYVWQRSFTFIELFIVIIIIGILIGVSTPIFRKTFNSLQLNSFSRELQSYMNYLHDRSIIEKKIIYFNIDNKNKQYWAQAKGTKYRLKTYPIPKGIDIEIKNKDTRYMQPILFFPDGQIDKVTLKIANPDRKQINLTTEGVFGQVKIQYE